MSTTPISFGAAVVARMGSHVPHPRTTTSTGGRAQRAPLTRSRTGTPIWPDRAARQVVGQVGQLSASPKKTTSARPG